MIRVSIREALIDDEKLNEEEADRECQGSPIVMCGNISSDDGT